MTFSCGKNYEEDLASRFSEFYLEHYGKTLKLARDKYKPSECKVLIIGESPPISGCYIYCLDNPFFNKKYNKPGKPVMVTKQSFPGIIATAFFNDSFKELKYEPVKFLTTFKDQGIFVMDALSYPVDGFSSSLRAKLVLDNLKVLKAKIEELTFEDDYRIFMFLPKRTLTALRVIQKSTDNNMIVVNKKNQVILSKSFFKNQKITIQAWDSIETTLRQHNLAQ